MKIKSNTRRGFTLVELLVVITIIAALAGLTAPMVIKQIRKADQTEAVNNAKNIGLAMFEFAQEYGRYPDATTQAQVDAVFDDSDVAADTTSSNGYFRQLIKAGITDSEDMFYAKVQDNVKPDGVLGADALEQGENGFGYILNVADGLSPSGNPARVLVATPLLPGGTTFDPDPFARKAVALRLDSSVRSFTILNNGTVSIGGGNTMLTGGPNTIWGTAIEPTIIPPE